MNSYIFHIPHSSIHLPETTNFLEQYIHGEINLVTDWKTEEIFDIAGVDKVIANFSRIFCDVERLSDNEEPMFKKGMGFYYTHGENGQVIRKLNQKYKQKIYENYYKPHHEQLELLVEKKIHKTGHAFIIDCHSFSSSPLKRELDQDPKRPDICLGTDTFHTTPNLVKKYESYFEKQGLSVAINKPYKGTIVPLIFYKKDSRVKSIMIEVNKKLYMNENTLEFFSTKINRLNNLLYKLLF